MSLTFICAAMRSLQALRPLAVLPFMLLLPLGAGAADVAGRVQFVVGEVALIKPDGAARSAGKGSEIIEGETVVTGREAQAQIVMADQAVIAVRPETRLKIEMFRYAGNDDENDRSFFALLRGGFRAITGQIGRIHRNGYRVRTPNATIGIRGTDHESFYIPEPLPDEAPAGAPGTYDKVNAGATVLQTDAGRIELGVNEVGFVAQLAGATPVRLPEVPGFMRGAPAPRAAGGRETGGSARGPGRGPSEPPARAPAPPGGVLPPVAPVVQPPVKGAIDPFNLPREIVPAANGYAMSGGDLSPVRQVGAGAGIVGNPANNFAAMLDASGSVVAVGGDGFSYARNGAPLIDSGSAITPDGTKVKWGVYEGGLIADGQGQRSPDFFHFMGGASATPIDSIKGTATFTTVGGFTKPINEAGQVGGSVLAGEGNTSIGVDFGAAAITSYKVTVQDARGYSFVGTSDSRVPISRFVAGNGTPLSVSCAGCASKSGDGSGHGVVIGTSGKGLVSSYDLRTTGAGGNFGVTGSMLLTR